MVSRVRSQALGVLPVRVQDTVRSVVDRASPTRRRSFARTHELLAEEVRFAARVSPDAVVLTGPFAGLRFPPGASWGGMGARLAGTYEAELGPALQRIIARRPELVIDVGAAEGYYSLGLARALPASTVLSYDIDPAAQRFCAAGAELNQLRNVDVRGRINPRELRRRLTPGAFVLSDCEGYERALLDPVTVPGLLTAVVLVELHEFCSPGLTQEVLARFADSHDAEIIDARPRRQQEGAHLTHLTAAEVDRALDEGRPTDPHPMQWAVFVPR